MTSSYSADFGGGGWGGFVEYMDAKNARIKDQLEQKHLRQEDGTLAIKSVIFAGCSFSIDGRTKILDTEIKRLVTEHGGIYEYWDLSKVTHFIADNLAMGNQRWRRYRERGSRRFVVVTSAWILDSIAADKRLNEADYLPACLTAALNGSRQLMSSFVKRGPDEAEVPSTSRSGSDHEVPPEVLLSGAIEPNSAPVTPTGSVQRISGDPLGSEAIVQLLSSDLVPQSTLSQPNPARDELPRNESVPSGLIPDPWAGLEDLLDQTSSSQDNNLSNEAQELPPGAERGPVDAALETEAVNDSKWEPMDVAEGSPCSLRSNSIEQAHSGMESPHDRNRLAAQPSPRAIGGSTVRLSCNDPNFVQNFFKSSRLHFIGRWRERVFSRFVLQPFVQPTLPPVSADHLATLDPTKRQTTEWTANRIFHVDFNSFFVSVAIKLSGRPELANLPVGVAHGSSHSFTSTSEIASCNYEARKYGVQKGSYISTAKAKCPNIQILPYDFDEIEACSDKLLHILTLVTPRVLPMSCDEAYMQLIDPVGVQHSLWIAAWIRSRVFQETGCEVSIGIGDSLLVAKMAGNDAKPLKVWGNFGIGIVPMPSIIDLEETITPSLTVGNTARRSRWREKARNRNSSSPNPSIFETYMTELVACVQRGEAMSPERFRVLEDYNLMNRLESMREYFADIPLKDLYGVGPSTLQSLSILYDVTTCGDLWKKIELSKLQTAFGKEKGLQLYEMAQGIDRRTIPTPNGIQGGLHGESTASEVDLKKTLTISVNWGVRLFTEENVLNFLRQMSSECQRRLETKGIGCSALTLKILVRHPEAPVDPPKFGGCGWCNEFTKKRDPTGQLMATTDDFFIAAKHTWESGFKGSFAIEDIRGVTFILSRLALLGKATSQQSTLESAFLAAETRRSIPDPTTSLSGEQISKPPLTALPTIAEPDVEDRPMSKVSPLEEVRPISTKKQQVSKDQLPLAVQRGLKMQSKPVAEITRMPLLGVTSVKRKALAPKTSRQAKLTSFPKAKVKAANRALARVSIPSMPSRGPSPTVVDLSDDSSDEVAESSDPTPKGGAVLPTVGGTLPDIEEIEDIVDDLPRIQEATARQSPEPEDRNVPSVAAADGIEFGDASPNVPVDMSFEVIEVDDNTPPPGKRQILPAVTLVPIEKPKLPLTRPAKKGNGGRKAKVKSRASVGSVPKIPIAPKAPPATTTAKKGSDDAALMFKHIECVADPCHLCLCSDLVRFWAVRPELFSEVVGECRRMGLLENIAKALEQWPIIVDRLK